MTIYVYPADATGCGHYRLIWPAQQMIKNGHKVTIVYPNERNIATSLAGRVKDGKLVKVMYPDDAELIILQRPTHAILHQAVSQLVDEGVPTIVDMDDDLSCIHPKNPAFLAMHPKKGDQHSWRYAMTACQAATMVTVSTPALAKRYALHGRYRVLYNCVPDEFFDIPRVETQTFGWAGSLHSHPNDLSVLGNVIQKLVHTNGHHFKVVSDATGVAKELRLTDVESSGAVPIEQWPYEVAKLKIGIAPLANTKFNAAKSWLKPLEYGALGIPWVASPRAEYERLFKLGAGMLANTPNDWYRHITSLYNDDALYDEYVGMCRDVSAQWSFSKKWSEWANAWQDAINARP